MKLIILINIKRLRNCFLPVNRSFQVKNQLQKMSANCTGNPISNIHDNKNSDIHGQKP